MVDAKAVTAPSETRWQARHSLLICGAALTLITLIGFVVPGSVFSYPRAIDAAWPLTEIYADAGGQFVFLALLIALSAAFLGAVVFSSQLDDQSLVRPLLAISIALAVLFALAYPSGSRDIFKNISDSRTLWVHGSNPYAVAPFEFRDDALLPSLTHGPLLDEPAYYGPGTYIAYGPATLIGGDSVLRNLVAFKFTHALALIGLTVLVWRAAVAINPARQLQSIVLVGWNPLVLYEGVANTHNDLLMSALLVLACFLAARSLTASFATLGASFAVKYVTAFCAPVMLRWLWLRGQRRLSLSLLALGLLTLAIVNTQRPLTNYGIFLDVANFTIYSVLRASLDPILGDLSVNVARWTCLGGFAVVALLALKSMDSSARSLYKGCFWIMFGASILAVSYFWQWYFLWFIPLGAVLAGSLEGEISALVSATGLISYGVLAYAEFNDQLNYLMIALLIGVPLLYLWLSSSRWFSDTFTKQEAPG